MKKNLIWIILALVVVIGGVYWYQQKEKTGGEKEVIKIGAILPLTGNSAEIGSQITNGIKLAEEKNHEVISITYADCQADPKKAVGEYNRLKAIGDYNIFIPTYTGVTNALAESAKNDLLFSTSVSASNITLKNDNLFRLFVNSKGDADKMAQFAIDSLHYSKICILALNDDFGKDYSETFKNKFKELGGTIVTEENFSKDKSDFKDLLTKINQNDYDAVYILAYDKNFVNLLKNYSELKIQKPILSIATIGQQSIRDGIKSYRNKLPEIYFTNTEFSSALSNSELKINFISSYKNTYNIEPNYFAAFAYDLTNIIAESISKGNKTNAEIKKYVLSNEFNGVMGKIKFNSERDAQFPMLIEKL